MPNQQALQVFYGTIPFMFIVGWAALNQRTLLNDILKRLGSIEAQLIKVRERLTTLETRAGIYQTGD